eukprot:GFYU01028567.1.p1 GENE.GFYU01028567.1~~GFYU01028567.1.p1  ORF type:complete len:355 (+),score=133.72 GFYU01028567.1:160-1065(+)
MDRVTEMIDETDFILHIGDLSYAESVGYIWEQFGTFIEDVASKKPYMTCIGNHEYDHASGTGPDHVYPAWRPSWGTYWKDSFGECGVPTYHRFRGSGNGWDNWYYSFNYGNVHVIMMSTEHDFTKGSKQNQWLEADLKAVDRSVTPWVVVGGHRPMYSSEEPENGYDYVIGQHMSEAFEDLLHEYKVDVAFWGHMHTYERTCPVYKGKCCEEGEHCTTHVVVGSAGASFDSGGFYEYEWALRKEESFWGFNACSATEDQLYCKFVENDNGSTQDEFTVTKPKTSTPEITIRPAFRTATNIE